MTEAFDLLSRPIQKWIREQGWSQLRDIQVRTIRAVAEDNNDIIIAASTAGGKTEAAFLPLISQVLGDEESQPGFNILYIGPLKALISDQARRLSDICDKTGLPVVPWHGDISSSVKTKASKNPAGIVLITPESLEALFVTRGAEIPRLFSKTKAIVIDELHTMLGTERGMQLQSLMTRIELSTGRHIRRVGLSATLGDMELAKAALRPDGASHVHLIEAKGGEAELRLQLRGYLEGDTDEAAPPPTSAIAEHLFKHLRGSDNLIFAGSRQRVEIYADHLRRKCESERLPQEFFAHHANIAKEQRQFIEKRLKDGQLPTSAICTSTLELGIDIGDVASVAQIGAPFSVASLRQRLGRSGRREDQPAVLRQYVIESLLDSKAHIADRLRLGTMRAIAMIDLLLENWCEPPRLGALHLSTLVHQILSVIASSGGARAKTLHSVLCVKGPFRSVDPPLFGEVLRAMGSTENALIEQSSKGLLLLGKKGEKLVEHYSFFAVFQTSEEYRLIVDGKELGTIPVDSLLAPGMMIIFSGRRWSVLEVRDTERVIIVTASAVGVPPIFGGDPGIIHDKVVKRMFDLLEGNAVPVYLDEAARQLLAEARLHYMQLIFQRRGLSHLGENTHLVFTRRGTIATNSLALALRGSGFTVEVHDGLLEVSGVDTGESLNDYLLALSNGASPNLFVEDTNLRFEKFDHFLTDALLQRNVLTSRLDNDCLTDMAKTIMGFAAQAEL